MPKASQSTAAHSASGPGYEGRFDELGDYTVAFEQFSDGGDMAPLSAACPTIAASAHTGGSWSRAA